MDDYAQFMKDFYTYTGIDLESYKRTQMERRLTSLRNRHGFPNFSVFFQALTQSDALLQEVLDKMTINVSEFFRNPERWLALVPHLVELAKGGPLNVWSAACSTGEEPYTLAMLLSEHVQGPFRILATDIDARVLEAAKSGEYKAQQVKSVPESYAAKYLRERNGSWYVEPALMRHVEFRQHNLLLDPYPTDIDLIVCRNVLIYFTDAAKQRIVNDFARSLRTGGLLFVGSTEQFLHTSPLLSSAAPFVYRRKDVVSR